MACFAKEKLYEYAENSLSTSEQAAVSSHLQNCHVCKEELDEINIELSYEKQLSKCINSSFEKISFEEKLFERIRKDQNKASSLLSFFKSFKFWVPAFATIILLIAMVLKTEEPVHSNKFVNSIILSANNDNSYINGEIVAPNTQLELVSFNCKSINGDFNFLINENSQLQKYNFIGSTSFNINEEGKIEFLNCSGNFSLLSGNNCSLTINKQVIDLYKLKNFSNKPVIKEISNKSIKTDIINEKPEIKTNKKEKAVEEPITHFIASKTVETNLNSDVIASNTLSEETEIIDQLEENQEINSNIDYSEETNYNILDIKLDNSGSTPF